MKKTWHWVAFVIFIAGGLFLLHNYRNHGGVAGVKSGLGLTTR